MTSDNQSELLYTAQDYEAAGLDVPEGLVDVPGLREGDRMTDEEVADFVKDSIATLRILADKRSPHYERVQAVFNADMAALLRLGRIGEDEYNGLTDRANLRF